MADVQIKEILMKMFKIIPSVVQMIKKDVSYNYKTYIKDIYDETKIIVDNYFKILNETKHFLESHCKTLDEVIVFLETQRVDYRSVRCEVRAIVTTDSFYLQNNEYANFMRGVLGVLQGGLESNALTDRGVKGVYHNHTINDIIDECKNAKRYINNANKIELNTKLIESVTEQEEELSKAWELVCQSYIKINKKWTNKLNN